MIELIKLEEVYLAGIDPWQRSGVGLRHPRTFEYWQAIRKPILDHIDKSGTILDIGCANGYLLECMNKWGKEKGIHLEPFGLDRSAALLKEAIERNPNCLFTHEDVREWKASRKFTYVLTELVYVGESERAEYIKRLLSTAVEPGGKLILNRYSSDAENEGATFVQVLAALGVEADTVNLATWEGKIKTESVAIHK